MYIENFEPVNGFLKFDNFRKTVIQKINRELAYFFDDEQQNVQIAINLLNSCFIIFNQQIIQNATDNEDFNKAEFFELLFYTNCFVVLKVIFFIF